MTEAWLERWQQGQIGWHESNGNSSLQKHWEGRGKRVLVPLCGKTQDLIWLERQGNEVVGVELSEIAVEAFFEENEIAYSRVEGALTEYVADKHAITIYCGDFFAFSAGPFDACYDRGALVALPPKLRRRYVEHLQSLLTTNAALLVICLEYDDRIASGPPFSITANEILSYWPDLKRIDAYNDVENSPPKFRQAGLNEVTEVVWRI